MLLVLLHRAQARAQAHAPYTLTPPIMVRPLSTACDRCRTVSNPVSYASLATLFGFAYASDVKLSLSSTDCDEFVVSTCGVSFLLLLPHNRGMYAVHLPAMLRCGLLRAGRRPGPPAVDAVLLHRHGAARERAEGQWQRHQTLVRHHHDAWALLWPAAAARVHRYTIETHAPSRTLQKKSVGSPLSAD